MIRLTPVVKNLILINVIVFLAGAISPERVFSCGFMSQMDVVSGYLALWNYQTICFKPYQLFTYMFVHGSFYHILFNMFGLAFLAPVLETYWGSKRFLVFYMIAGIGAAVFNILVIMILNIGAFGSMVGASGALYGVLMAFGLIFPNMELSLMFFPIRFKAKYFVLVMALITFFSSATGSNSGIAHFAHMGGLVVGFIVVQIWRRQ